MTALKKNNPMEYVYICVYRDTIEQHNKDWNLSEILVTKEFAERYFNECIRMNDDNNYNTFQEFLSEFTADDTLGFYQYANENQAIIEISHWSS